MLRTISALLLPRISSTIWAASIKASALYDTPVLNSLLASLSSIRNVLYFSFAPPVAAYWTSVLRPSLKLLSAANALLGSPCLTLFASSNRLRALSSCGRPSYLLPTFAVLMLLSIFSTHSLEQRLNLGSAHFYTYAADMWAGKAHVLFCCRRFHSVSTFVISWCLPGPYFFNCYATGSMALDGIG